MMKHILITTIAGVLVHQSAGPFLDLKNKRYQQVNELFPIRN
jgi:hypothetical protein